MFLSEIRAKHALISVVCPKFKKIFLGRGTLNVSSPPPVTVLVFAIKCDRVHRHRGDAGCDSFVTDFALFLDRFFVFYLFVGEFISRVFVHIGFCFHYCENF